VPSTHLWWESDQRGISPWERWSTGTTQDPWTWQQWPIALIPDRIPLTVVKVMGAKARVQKLVWSHCCWVSVQVLFPVGWEKLGCWQPPLAQLCSVLILGEVKAQLNTRVGENRILTIPKLPCLVPFHWCLRGWRFTSLHDPTDNTLAGEKGALPTPSKQEMGEQQPFSQSFV
jgi:hypothetical protein